MKASGFQRLLRVAADAADDSTMTQVVHNCAPALSNDLKTLYAAVSDSGAAGYLVALKSRTLARLKPTERVRLLDLSIIIRKSPPLII
jgi:hypothetical protein